MNHLLRLEYLPDEIILEIYRYLHCGHILYSFYNLNTRLNHTITDYCHHVILRRLTYQQFLYLYSNILPKIGRFILSLTINRLQQTYFFSVDINEVFPNLNKLALDDWKTEDLFTFVSNHLTQLKYLRRIIIRGLRQTNKEHSFVNLIDDHNHLLEMIHKNTQIEYICFEPDCYSMTLLINKKSVRTYSNLIEMNICLSTSNDLVCLANLIPSIRRIHVSIEELLPIDQDITPFQCLTHFSLDAIDCYSTLENISSIFQLTPTIKYLSLVLTTEDDRLIYGEHLSALLSSELFNNNNNLIESFKYVVCFSASVDYYFDSKNCLESWKSLSIAYTINKDEKKLYILVHTLPYPSIILNLHSTLTNKFGVKIGDQVYNNIQYLCIIHAKTLFETFIILQHCRKIEDLTIQIDENKTSLPVIANKPYIPYLPKLKQLEILSIFGIVDNWQHFKLLIIAAHNLSTLCIDLDCVMKLFENPDEDILFPRVLHLFIDGQRSNIKLTNEHIRQLAKVFRGIHSLKIKYKTEYLIEGNVIGSILDNFKHLIVFTINGQISDDISSEHISEWLIEYSSRLKNSNKNNYQIELIDNWFQIWL